MTVAGLYRIAPELKPTVRLPWPQQKTSGVVDRFSLFCTQVQESSLEQ